MTGVNGSLWSEAGTDDTFRAVFFHPQGLFKLRISL